MPQPSAWHTAGPLAAEALRWRPPPPALVRAAAGGRALLPPAPPPPLGGGGLALAVLALGVPLPAPGTRCSAGAPMPPPPNGASSADGGSHAVAVMARGSQIQSASLQLTWSPGCRSSIRCVHAAIQEGLFLDGSSSRQRVPAAEYRSPPPRCRRAHMQRRCSWSAVWASRLHRTAGCSKRTAAASPAGGARVASPPAPPRMDPGLNTAKVQCDRWARDGAWVAQDAQRANVLCALDCLARLEGVLWHSCTVGWRGGGLQASLSTACESMYLESTAKSL